MSYFRNLTTSLKGGRFLRGIVGRLSFSVIDRGRTWKEHMEIMNKENEWDNMTQADAVEGPTEMVTQGEIVKVMGKMKSGKVAGPSEVSLEMITSSGVVGKYNNRTMPAGVGWEGNARGLEDECGDTNL